MTGKKLTELWLCPACDGAGLFVFKKNEEKMEFVDTGFSLPSE